MNEELRINKYLAKCGLGSRRFCENLIKEGRVKVNGEFLWDLGVKINPTDEVMVDEKLITPKAERIVLMLHKPAGYLCSKGDPFGRATIYELLPTAYQELHYVGRLDLDTRGLLLLTNDGELSKRLTHPEFGLTRCYQVLLNQSLREEDAEELESGLVLADGTEYRPVRLSALGREFDIELKEGKKREIREMMKHFGYRVQDLFRFEYGGIWLDDLPEGEHRELTNDELEQLLQQVGL